MGLLEGRKGLIFGIANDRSIACHIAAACLAEGATCGFPHLPSEKNGSRVAKALEEIGVTDPWLISCDVSKDEEIDAVFSAARERFDALDFVVHSIAYADRTYLKPGKFVETSRDTFAQGHYLRAERAALARRCGTAFRNLGQGLHSLQDKTSHCWSHDAATPLDHITKGMNNPRYLGRGGGPFRPDWVSRWPRDARIAENQTRQYLEKFLDIPCNPCARRRS